MRSVKWWKTVFFFLLDISLINAFILYQATQDVPLTIAYCRILINELTSLERPAGDTTIGPMRPGFRHVSGHYAHRLAENHCLRPYKRGRDERQPKIEVLPAHGLPLSHPVFFAPNATSLTVT